MCEWVNENWWTCTETLMIKARLSKTSENGWPRFVTVYETWWTFEIIKYEQPCLRQFAEQVAFETETDTSQPGHVKGKRHQGNQKLYLLSSWQTYWHADLKQDNIFQGMLHQSFMKPWKTSSALSHVPDKLVCKACVVFRLLPAKSVPPTQETGLKASPYQQPSYKLRALLAS